MNVLDKIFAANLIKSVKRLCVFIYQLTQIYMQWFETNVIYSLFLTTTRNR